MKELVKSTLVCKKCGSKKQQVVFHERAALCSQQGVGDHLHKYCSACGYEWAEKTRDHKAAGDGK